MLYRFNAKSSLSFPVVIRGRETHVTFSSQYRDSTSFFTKDPLLADKIRHHRWFRQGRITEVVAVEEPEETAKQEVAKESTAQHVYSILGRRLVSPTRPSTVKETEEAASAEIHKETAPATEETVPTETAEQVEAVKEETTEEETTVEGVQLDEVESFMEAKEYLVTHFEVERASLRSKQDIINFCEAHDITFPNYNPAE